MIHLTKVVQPEVGGVILHHCSGCRMTEIYVSEFAVKPEDGDVWMIDIACPRHGGWLITPGHVHSPGTVTVRKAMP